MDRTVLPIRRPPFSGVVRRTLDGSEPDWSQIGHTRPPEGAPNVLLVLIDDAGFGNPSAYGGPVRTPNFDRMATQGLRYNRFHVTALCSPTRAALLTGRNHHTVGFGSVGEFSAGFPGYSANLPRDCAPLPRILRDNGYSTGAFGKWHLTPDGQQGPAGPFDRWPNAWGFDHFWGFLGGESGQFDPVITENNRTVGVPDGRDGEQYYLPDDMADKTIEWLHGIRAQDSAKPWFAYFSTGCSHAPHHVPAEWADRYRGRFDGGWDAYREETFARQKELGVIPAAAQLTPRPDELPAWESLDEDRKRYYARQMEVYAGYQENADWNVGRVLAAIEEMGELEDTLVIWIWGDNGASMEGTVTGSFNELTMLNGIPLTDEQQLEVLQQYGGPPMWGTEMMAPHYSAAWAWAGNCPFQWGKQVASHLGGTRNPMVVHWPARVRDPGALRSHFTHVIDVAPTVLEIAGIPQPTKVDGIPQEPMHGVTFADSLHDADAPERHTRQYFEILGNRAMYADGWWLSMRMPRIPWDATPETLRRFAPGEWNPDADPVELYYLPEDFTQAWDLAETHPEKVAELRELFWQEAERFRVLPLLSGFSVWFGMLPPLPQVPQYTFFGDVQNVASGMIPRVYGHSYTISAELVIPAGGAEGVIVAEADHLGGFSLFVLDGKLMHTYSMMGMQVYRQAAADPLPAGEVQVAVVFAADAAKPGTGGQITLLVNDRPVGGGRMDSTVPFRFSGYAGMDIGRDNGMPVDRIYADRSPFPFTGTVKKVVFDIQPHGDLSAEHALHEHAQRSLAAHGMNG
ncbi:arylsulfatase [Hamadaea flava]|uniref:Arylsulfatase n=1 Tax=Hamadaea flava TaxID=1742688 RepID=A0ABV8LYF4_9ACTN|nr:arylsulfatase [Hamadaea flava]MCP2322209.1 arylsulfatase [Hamadaea flava]